MFRPADAFITADPLNSVEGYWRAGGERGRWPQRQRRRAGDGRRRLTGSDVRTLDPPSLPTTISLPSSSPNILSPHISTPSSSRLRSYLFRHSNLTLATHADSRRRLRSHPPTLIASEHPLTPRHRSSCRPATRRRPFSSARNRSTSASTGAGQSATLTLKRPRSKPSGAVSRVRYLPRL